MFDKDNKFGFIINNNNENSNNIKNTDLPYTVSSKVLATVPASDVAIDDIITVNNASINKDRRYYIEFLGSKKLCSMVTNKTSSAIICNIGNYIIQASNDSTNISVYISKINEDDTATDTFTDLIIYEEEVKYLDSKYLETNLVLQNSISLGRVGDIGIGSSAIGSGVTASGNGSHAEGGGTIASAECSHAEGTNTTASGEYSHAEGYNATASGYSSHAEGGSTTALGDGSHAEGSGTTASGESSHAEGNNTKASSKYQHVQGQYNIEDKDNKYAHIVGNGKKDKSTNFKEVRSNAHTLDWEGNGWYAGKLSQEGTPTEDKDLTTKKYVDDSLNNILSFNESGELVVTINGVSKTFVPKE